MKPFVKWPGGKSDEINTIKEYMPINIRNYIEPFLGGGACYFSLHSNEYNRAYLNDFSEELIKMYILIKERNQNFYNCLIDIWNFWNSFTNISQETYQIMRNVYGVYKTSNDERFLKLWIEVIIEENRDIILKNLPESLKREQHEVIKQLKKTVVEKLKNIKRKELKDGDLPEKDYRDNFEGAVKASIYTYYRTLYNNRIEDNIDEELHIALFFYQREFAYSSMFRYNSSGGFNVPYGGITYNNKRFDTKIQYITSNEMYQNLRNARFFNLDFERFLGEIEINQDDFMFVDPPYDEAFSTYANNKFEKSDQIRLANYLINRCECKFIMIIKNTDFIAELYENRPNIDIVCFDKDYKVSFMDRNDKKVKHLLIKNY